MVDSNPPEIPRAKPEISKQTLATLESNLDKLLQGGKKGKRGGGKALYHIGDSRILYISRMPTFEEMMKSANLVRGGPPTQAKEERLSYMIRFREKKDRQDSEYSGIETDYSFSAEKGEIERDVRIPLSPEEQDQKREEIRDPQKMVSFVDQFLKNRNEQKNLGLTDVSESDVVDLIKELSTLNPKDQIPPSEYDRYDL